MYALYPRLVSCQGAQQGAGCLFAVHSDRGGEQHATVVEFVEERLGTAYVAQVRLFDQMRRKRHRVIYEVAGLVSKKEAEQAIAFAREIVEKITEIIIGQSRLGIQ
jgi:uncharacterized protein (UPF0332 family)